MRRWIVAVLVLANLGLLLWGSFYLEADQPAIAEAQPAIAPEKMRLLPRAASPKIARTKTPAVNADAPLSTPPTSEQPLPGASICYRLGPFQDLAAAQKVEQALSAQSLSFARREETKHSVSGYRVYLPPLASKEEAEKQRRELTRLGFKDHALIHDDGMNNAISLGMFAVEANAQTRVKELAQKGIHAKLEPMDQKTQGVYWIELAPVAGAANLRDRLNAAILQGTSSAAVRDAPCPTPPTPPAKEPDLPG